MDEYSILTYSLAGFATLYVVASLMSTRSPELDRIPSIGHSGPLTSYLTALRYFSNAPEMSIEGYRKHRNGVFRIANWRGWIVFCCGPSHVDDIRKASEDELSIIEAANDNFHMPYTLGPELADDPYHFAVINPTLTRNVPACVGDIQDEVVQSLSDLIRPNGDEWQAISLPDAMPNIIGQVVNRVLVGLPLCRNRDYLDMCTSFTLDVMGVSLAINTFPKFLRPLAGKYLTRLPAYTKRAERHLAPIFDEHMQNEAQYGKDSPLRPNILLTWLIDAAPESRRNLRDLCLRLLFMNFAAIHTTSMTFTHVLYFLAANPQYVQPLRDEVESVVDEEGWTKAGLDRMLKVDSFIREAQRTTGLGVAVLLRKTMRDFKLSDGTIIPAGHQVTVPTFAIHHDEEYYTDPNTFDPFRFSNAAEKEQQVVKYQTTTLSYEWNTWGVGKYACPGRFFAAAVMKIMLAYMVITYDLKFENEGVRPSDHWIMGACIPNRSVKVLARRRVQQT